MSSTPSQSTWDLARYEALIAVAEAKRRALLAEAQTRNADLPLQFWQQQAHFTTPASDFGMLQKAIENGMSATSKILDKFAITPADVAEAFGCGEADVRAVLGG